MMRDETVATTYVQDARLSGQAARDFQRHIVRATDFSAPSFAPPATLCSVKERCD